MRCRITHKRNIKTGRSNTMKRRWCVREDIFHRENRMWWLEKEKESENAISTPMTVALNNGGISRVIDVKLGGFESFGRRRKI
jgi:hypothetical protein